VKRILRWIGLFILCAGIALFAQDREVRQLFSIGGQHYAFTGSVDTWNELQRQIKLNNLLCDIMADEARGLHPWAKIRLAKKLAQQLQE
jgi:hypothetical protein